MESDQSFQKKLCQYCFANLEKFLEEKQAEPYPDDFDKHEYPLFVTWNYQGMLRGCIGTFKSDKLGKTL